jgi:hypothetical protein
MAMPIDPNRFVPRGDAYEVYAQERDIQQWAEDNYRRRTTASPPASRANEYLSAWGCAIEAKGLERCSRWCGQSGCPTSTSGVTPSSKDPK